MMTGDYFKNCLMVVGLTFVIYQMMYLYIKAGRSQNHYSPCYHFTPLPTTPLSYHV